MSRSAAEDRPRARKPSGTDAGDARAAAPAGGGGEPATDADLARAARDGDRDAFSQLYERHAKTVHGILLAVVPPQEASDLVQDVFVSALRAIRGLAEPERVGAWLCSIARNRGRDHARRRTPTLDVESLEAVPADEDTDSSEVEEVLAVIRGLPDAYRETLVLRLVEGLAGPEIAERTGMTHGSVRVNLHRGMKLLRTIGHPKCASP